MRWVPLEDVDHTDTVTFGSRQRQYDRKDYRAAHGECTPENQRQAFEVLETANEQVVEGYLYERAEGQDHNACDNAGSNAENGKLGDGIEARKASPEFPDRIVG